MLQDLITLALAPCFILLHAIYVLDRHEKEPVRNLFRYLLAGVVAALMSGLIEAGINVGSVRSDHVHVEGRVPDRFAALRISSSIVCVS